MATKKKESKTTVVSAKVKPSIKKKLEKLAEEQDRKLSWVISKILTENVDN